jgi:hypothetical protein
MSTSDTNVLNPALNSLIPQGPFNQKQIQPQPRVASSYALAGSNSDLSRFSHVPLSTSTFTDTKVVSNALLPSSQVNAIANANAVFMGGAAVPLSQTLGGSEALSIAEGNGRGYEASAIARTQVKALDFYLKPKQTFSFNFSGNMSLFAEGVGRRQQSSAQSRTTYQIFGTTACGCQTLLDQMIIDGRQVSNDRGSFGSMKSVFSRGFKLNVQPQPLSFAANELSFNGTYSRTFRQAMKITIVEIQQTNAEVRFTSRGNQKRFR